MIHHAAGSTDHDVRTTHQTAKLALVRLAAVDRQRFDLAMPAETVQRFGNLNRQFARRRQNQRLTARGLVSIPSMIGKPKAAVFPEPVCAWAMTSAPVIMTGMVLIWIGVGSS